MGDDSELIKALGFRKKSMAGTFGNVRPSFEEVANWIDPARGRHLGQGLNGDRRKQQMLIDSTPRRAYRTIKAGLMSGLSSPSRPWFRLKMGNAGGEEMRPSHKAYLSQCQRIIYDVLSASNAYQALQMCYGDLALFGVYAGVVHSSYENVIHVQSFPVGSFLLADDDEGRSDTLHWQLNMTVAQLVAKFGLENVSDRVKQSYERNDLHAQVKVNAAIEPRRVKDPMAKWQAKNKAIAIYYWEDSVTDKLLHNGGLDTNGILGPRWEVVTDDPWPISSPARDALGDVKQLQTQQRDRDMAVQMANKPPMVGPAEGALFSYNPAAYNVLTMGDMAKGAPQPLVQVNQRIDALDSGIGMTQQRVDEAFYADLFRMVSAYGMQGAKDVTATAIAAMQEEKLIVLGPVLDNLDRNLLGPLVESTFRYCQDAEILPPAPDDLVGGAINVEFTSLLAQAQRALGISAIERTIGFAGTVAQVTGSPDVLRNFDMDGLVREVGDQVGFPMDKFRDPAELDAERQAAEQQAQQQMMMQQAQPMAQAANLISEANARGQEALAEQGIV